MPDGGSFASGYDSSEIDAELATWDAIKEAWDDVESHRVEEQTLVPMREACSLLADAASDVRMEVSLLSDELERIENM